METAQALHEMMFSYAESSSTQGFVLCRTERTVTEDLESPICTPAVRHDDQPLPASDLDDKDEENPDGIEMTDGVCILHLRFELVWFFRAK